MGATVGVEKNGETDLLQRRPIPSIEITNQFPSRSSQVFVNAAEVLEKNGHKLNSVPATPNNTANFQPHKILGNNRDQVQIGEINGVLFIQVVDRNPYSENSTPKLGIVTNKNNEPVKATPDNIKKITEILEKGKIFDDVKSPPNNILSQLFEQFPLNELASLSKQQNVITEQSLPQIAEQFPQVSQESSLEM